MREHVCECPGRGECPLHKMFKTARQHAICNGTSGLSDADRAAHLQHWSKLAGTVSRTPAGPAVRAAAVSTRHVALAGVTQCIHRGGKTREDVSNLCGSRGKQVEIYQCALHGECSLGRYCQHQTIRTCLTCEDRTEPALPDEPTRHLIGHIWPKRDNWQWCVDELLKRIDVFNGTRAIGVVTDGNTDSLEAVQSAFSGHRIDRWIHRQNNPTQREGVTFFPLMDELPRGVGDLTWYWHSKSVQHTGGNGMPRHWADMQHRVMLDGWRDVQNDLRSHPITGAFKRTEGWQMQGTAKWHYTGTAFAFRNADVFLRDWRKLSKTFFCVEFWPPTVFSSDEAGCVFGDGATDLYRPENWERWNREMEDRCNTNLAAATDSAARAG